MRHTPLIIDFGLSTINSEWVDVGYAKQTNRYIDINKLVNNILYTLEKRGGTQFVEPDLLRFLESIVPGSKRVGLDPENNLRFSIWHKKSPYEWTGEGKVKRHNGKSVLIKEPSKALLPSQLVRHPIFKSLSGPDPKPGYEFFMTPKVRRSVHGKKTVKVSRKKIPRKNKAAPLFSDSKTTTLFAVPSKFEKKTSTQTIDSEDEYLDIGGPDSEEEYLDIGGPEDEYLDIGGPDSEEKYLDIG